jgi:hypothetical protein
MGSRRPILVTGIHRSGSTWLGQTLARSRDVIYIAEPFNPEHPPGICDLARDHWLLYVCDENQERFAPALDHTMALSYSALAQWRHDSSWTGLRQLIGEWRDVRAARRTGKRVLLKDPIALFSAPWLARRYQMQVVVLIRHPAAFAASWKRVRWNFDYENLVAQPALLRDLLAPFETQIRDYARKPPDFIDSAIMQWNLAHHAIGIFERQHPEWIFVRHEDLSADPVAAFERLFPRIGLDFTDDVRRWIANVTAPTNPVDADEGVIHQIVRDSAATRKSWKRKLDAGEIQRIRRGVEPIASRYYDDCEW